jgi:tetratricopeptide (TPR) repeat protein
MTRSRGRSIQPAALTQVQPIDRPTPLSSIHYIALTAVFALAGLLAMRQVIDLDVGFHLKVGNQIIDGHGWPQNDTFTYTLNDRPYIDTSWGYQVVLAAVERHFHAPGMVVMHALLVLGCFSFLLLTARLYPVDATILVLFMAAGVVACEIRYQIRPEVWSYFLLSGLLYLLTRHAEGRASPLWLLVPLHLVWANSHSYSVLGWVTMAAFIVALLIRDRKFDWRLIKWVAAAIAICVLNPYGLQGMLFPLTLMTRFDSDNTFARVIGEFFSPFSLSLSKELPYYPLWPIWTFRVFAVVCVLALWPMLKSRRYWPLFLLLVMMPLAAKMVRNVPLLVIALLPPTAAAIRLDWFGRLIRLGPVGMKWAHRSVIGLVMIVTVMLGMRVATNAYYIDARRLDRTGWSWDRLNLPVDAAEYVRRVGLRGNMLNHLNFGHYLIWAQPNPVFIHGQLEIVGERFYRHYEAILGLPEVFAAVMKRHQFQWVIFPYALNPPLLQRLSTDANWRLAYFDHLAVIFVRNTPEAEKFIDPNLNELLAQGEPMDTANLPGLGGAPREIGLRGWLLGCVEKQSIPADDDFRGLFHLFRGEAVQAERRFIAAIRKSRGRQAERYHNLAEALILEKRYAEAAACYRVVLDDDPTNAAAQERVRVLTSASR